MARLEAAHPFLVAPSPPPSAPRARRLRLPCYALFLAGVAVSALLLLHHHNLGDSPVPTPATASNFHSLLLALGSNDTAAAHLRALTTGPHVAGTPANSRAAAYVRAAFASLSIPSHITSYSVLLSYPLHRSLALITPRNTAAFSLLQETYPGDPYAAASADVMPTFYAYSGSGSALAAVVYANYGREKDFAYLASRGVEVAGKVVLARYGKIHCEDITHNARAAGAAAAVVYPDPLEYRGEAAEGWFPDARWLPPSGVQVGSLFRGTGDPTTPMWASSEGCERLSVEEAMGRSDMPRIPALPVSAQDAMEIHRSMGGPVAPPDWQGRDGSPVYRLGPGPAVLNLTYIGNDTMATIENVFAVIEGAEEPDRYVILGNHRDAWTFGGADPNSGTAAMIELAHRLSELQKKGWRPRRTIIFCSWDAEEYALTGSTEWVEENREILSSKAVAYMNVDVSTVGRLFHPRATPQLDELMQETIKMVQDPENSSQTVYDSWIKSKISPMIGRLGNGGSDFGAFVEHIGIPTTDMYYGEGPGYPVYHSLYDDYVWVAKYADPGFRRHVAVASIWGLMALRLANDDILPLNYIPYVVELEKYTKVVENEVKGMPVTCAPLYNSIKDLNNAAMKVESERAVLQRQLSSLELSKDSTRIRALNDRLMMTERAFTSREGIFQQEWSKHLIYGTSEQNDWETASYPGVADAIARARRNNTAESWRFVQHEIYRVARAVTQASAVLSGRLT